MCIQDGFIAGVETTFDVLNEAVKSGSLVVTVDDGWGTTTTDTYPVRVIVDVFSKEDLNDVSFSDLVQHTDLKGLVPGADITVDVKTGHFIDIDGKRYTIVEFETDPFNVMYTILLRNA